MDIKQIQEDRKNGVLLGPATLDALIAFAAATQQTNQELTVVVDGLIDDKKKLEQGQAEFNRAIEFAMQPDNRQEMFEFLNHWNHGDWDVLEKEWKYPYPEGVARIKEQPHG